MTVEKYIQERLQIPTKSIESTLQLLSEDCTIPFIARYRKDKTGGLSEEEIKVIGDAYDYQVNLLKRKEDVIRLIDEKGLLTDELKSQITNATKLVEVEDLYRPYKEKKKTKATEAIKNGLEPLAKMIMSCPLNGDIKKLSEKFINENVKDETSALEGAKYIIAVKAKSESPFLVFAFVPTESKVILLLIVDSCISYLLQLHVSLKYLEGDFV